MAIEGNTFERGFPLYVGESGDGWLEGPPVVSDVLVQNNTFRSFYSGKFAVHAWPATTHNVSVRGNRCFGANGTRVSCTDAKSPTLP
jgi:hypothetical protein